MMEGSTYPLNPVISRQFGQTIGCQEGHGAERIQSSGMKPVCIGFRPAFLRLECLGKALANGLTGFK